MEGSFNSQLLQKVINEVISLIYEKSQVVFTLKRNVKTCTACIFAGTGIVDKVLQGKSSSLGGHVGDAFRQLFSLNKPRGLSK